MIVHVEKNNTMKKVKKEKEKRRLSIVGLAHIMSCVVIANCDMSPAVTSNLQKLCSAVLMSCERSVRACTPLPEPSACQSRVDVLS